jgi:Cu(I)/Ag(I) efflux system membrane fusion protein
MTSPTLPRVLLAATLILLGTTSCTRHDADSTRAPAGSAEAQAARKILYYRNPMGLADTSPVPKKDAMGMDYVPVYADEAVPAGQVRVASDRLQKLGVRTEPARRRPLERTLHLAGALQPVEGRLSAVSPRFEGWVEELYATATGDAVRAGEPLAAAYAPEPLAAHEDIRIAESNREAVAAADAETRARAESLVAASRTRLANFGLSEGDFRRGSSGRMLVLLRATRSGVVTEKTARLGMRFMPGDALYQVADLSRLWLVASVFEQDLGLVHRGMEASATLAAFPGRTFRGRVSFISPIVQPETRSVQVRIELENGAGTLKPSMFASVDLAAGPGAPTLVVPEGAVLDTGTRRLVIVDRGNGTFEPRTVRTGARGAGYAEILEGLSEGDPVVVDGNFLIDAESNLKAVIDSMRPSDAPAEPRP